MQPSKEAGGIESIGKRRSNGSRASWSQAKKVRSSPFSLQNKNTRTWLIFLRTGVNHGKRTNVYLFYVHVRDLTLRFVGIAQDGRVAVLT
jgi:hypothetical protein